MRKIGSLVLLFTALALLLTGCSFKSPEELYTLPQPSEEYESLQRSLAALLDSGYEYAAPVSGSNAQSVQLKDLDGDGEDEAIAFLRDSAGENHPMKICIFRCDEDGNYDLWAKVEGDGDGFNSVSYCQLNGTDTLELVVGWRISSTVYTLSAYSIENGNVTELMTIPSYQRYTVRDMDQDNQAEIVVIQLSTAEEGGNIASYYDWSENTMMNINSVALSASADSLESLRYYNLVDNAPGLYVTSYLVGDSSSLVTDILSVVDKKLVNITLDSATGDSDTVHLGLTAPTDINNDNVLELPIAYPLRTSGADSSDLFYVIDWVQYTQSGDPRSMGYTYHNTADGWYLSLPSSWLTSDRAGGMNGLMLVRSDTNVGATVERSITFYRKKTVTSDPERFLTIYKNTGTNRESRAVMGERFLLTEDDTATYSAEFFDCSWNCGLDKSTILDQFHLILTNWSSD
jgi:hypothetical protein